jgi:hypothetical protein
MRGWGERGLPVPCLVACKKVPQRISKIRIDIVVLSTGERLQVPEMVAQAAGRGIHPQGWRLNSGVLSLIVLLPA